MPSQQQIAWIIYLIIFIPIFISLVWRCKFSVMTTPIIFFTLLCIVGLCVLLFGQSSEYGSFSFMAGHSQILGQFPLISILLFAAVLNPQVAYIQHAFKIGPSISSSEAFIIPPGSTTRTRSSGSFDMEKPPPLFSKEPSYQKELMPPKLPIPSRVPNTLGNAVFKKYYVSVIGIFTLYTITAIAFICIRLIEDNYQVYTHIAICTTILAAISWINITMLFYGTRNDVSRHIPLFRLRQNDTQRVWIISLLFSYSITGMAIVSWIYWSLQINAASIDIAYWIVIEALLVYTPLVALLLFYIREKKISLIKNQYSLHMETKRKSATMGPKSHAQEEMKYVTREISLQTARHTPAPVESHSRPLSYQNRTEPLPL
ncbi:hypothetical protein J3Q64DRAFT_1758591 [Phycomyces blakesleeanus]|uniref:Uncharacterized protein n=2 Tax=Phycomyces blakesleeanus TaxID=4837 RepID=A0A167KY01_PHYB8|nr:hypothetical protein PHYBLDRAFT_149538 [Phycomyces blakesleeanus NRRL 1555(-)]OAD69139.1 hypothetical protein PHYBLDRAFT_149538 [Phycomyces blakesleeanus NRRL 1555(-)]|eukprot:XP_018287179.1 hypothetical protein PHYBLDRAFT_149538 [Phycomyces blakesleeanus NRRL 1555(-)]